MCRSFGSGKEKRKKTDRFSSKKGERKDLNQERRVLGQKGKRATTQGKNTLSRVAMI